MSAPRGGLGTNSIACLYGCFRKSWVFPLKSSILIGYSIINHPFGGPTPIFGNTHISLQRWIPSRIPDRRVCLTETNSSRSLEQNALSLMRKVMAAWWQDETFLGLGGGGCTQPNRLMSHCTCMYLYLCIYTHNVMADISLYYFCLCFTEWQGYVCRQHAFCHCSFCSNTSTLQACTKRVNGQWLVDTWISWNCSIVTPRHVVCDEGHIDFCIHTPSYPLVMILLDSAMFDEIHAGTALYSGLRSLRCMRRWSETLGLHNFVFDIWV